MVLMLCMGQWVMSCVLNYILSSVKPMGHICGFVECVAHYEGIRLGLYAYSTLNSMSFSGPTKFPS